MIDSIKRLYIRATGYSYTNLGRLFLRLFIGIMLIQFGVRQMVNFNTAVQYFPSVFGMGPEASLIVLICIETVCSLFIMAGFCTRLMLTPPIIAMIIAEIYLVTDKIDMFAPYMLTWQQQGYLPMMFIGTLFFLLLVGPGKISIDYFLSLYILHSEERSEEELEEV